MENPLSPHVPLNHCPPLLVPIMLEVLAAHNAAMPSVGEGIHEETLEMAGSDYDLLVLYYTAFETPFSCRDAHHGVTHTLSFVDKPAVVQENLSSTTGRYSVQVKLMKLPTVPW